MGASRDGVELRGTLCDLAAPHEPPHVHVVRDDMEAKFWLDPLDIARAGTFTPVELRRIERTIEENRYALLERWDASFGV